RAVAWQPPRECLLPPQHTAARARALGDVSWRDPLAPAGGPRPPLQCGGDDSLDRPAACLAAQIESDRRAATVRAAPRRAERPAADRADPARFRGRLLGPATERSGGPAEPGH